MAMVMALVMAMAILMILVIVITVPEVLRQVGWLRQHQHQSFYKHQQNVIWSGSHSQTSDTLR
jgi:hypothetical protein